MKFSNIESINDKDYDLIVIGVDKNGELSYTNKQICRAYNFVIDNKTFSLKNGEIKSVIDIEEKIIFIFIFLDEKEMNNATKTTKMYEKLYQSIIKENPNRIAITFSDMVSNHAMNLLVQSFIMSEYSFDKYFSKKKNCDKLLVDINGKNTVNIKANVNKANGANFTKGLVNNPANFLTPEVLAKETVNEMEGTDVEVDILDIEEIEKLGMKAFLSVAKGSKNPPKLIVMTYIGNPSCKKITGLVGKGVTYDSGGFSLKTSKGMVNMKNDMGGSAAVIGAMKIIGENKVEANVIGVVAACENILSKDAYLPGDVIGSMAGKTIEIRSTDAEGRLTIADALTYIIREKKVDRVIDIATLTGAAASIFAKFYTPYLSTDKQMTNSLEKASAACGERIWRMPIIDEVNEKLESKIADLKNSQYDSAPGMISAGMFIAKFNENIPWTHIDIAGKALIDNLATGYGARLLAEMIENLSKIQK